MSDLGQHHSTALGLAAPAGLLTGVSTINKFGRAPSGVQTSATDIWDRADATPTQQIWVAPTIARVHQIASSSGSDDGDPVGVGARTIRVWGLSDWDTAETSQDLTLNGATDVATSAYVIIYRMRILTWGATSINVGTITATADGDGTVTAAILPGQGQTQMAIYGVPSVQNFYMAQYYASFLKSGGATGSVDVNLLVNTAPDTELTNFTVKHTAGRISAGTSGQPHRFDPYFKIDGPAIVKMQCVGSTADLDVSAGFDGYCITE